jgi:glyoxylase-like metal-dependent hydrolase (beta-lactamase superfamily II)
MLLERKPAAGAWATTAANQIARAQGSAVELAPHAFCLPLSLVNVFFVRDAVGAGNSWVLIDTALSTSAGTIRRAAAERFGPHRPPTAIVLTHGHFDHVGALGELLKTWDVPVYAHRAEFPFLTGRSSYPPPDPSVGGGLMSLSSPLFPRGPIDVGRQLKPLPADGSVPGLPGWRWIHTPGHTPGHVSLFRDEDRTLIAGDAFVTTRQESAICVLTQRPVVSRPPAYYTIDWDQARKSVEALQALRPKIAGTGHGPAMSGEQLRQGLNALVSDWESVAVPPRGRYVRRPATVNDLGVVDVPPPSTSAGSARLKWAAAALLLGVAATVVLKQRSKSDWAD